MGEVREVYFSGFCRTCNGVQSVCCEYIQGEGSWQLDTMYCQEKSCQHQVSCEIYRQAHQSDGIPELG